MEFSFKVLKKDRRVRARAGVIRTPHGEIQTPCFSPVATKAVVRALDVVDLIKAKTQVVLGNTYHLYLRPGTKTIEGFDGFAPFMKWNGPTITDSGGYQVSFLWTPKNLEEEPKGKMLKTTDAGTLFASHIDGSKHLLSPEKSMEIQSVLGADIIMALDQPMGFKFSDAQNKEAYLRTFKWEERSFTAWDKLGRKSKYGKYQALFGIIQGQLDKKLRLECLKFILSMGFPGIAIGDETIGVDPKITAMSLDTVSELLPDDKPLHALGLGGGPEGIFEAVERGVDLFDNSSITRMARHGLLFVGPSEGGKPKNKFRIAINKSIYKEDEGPVSRRCECYSCLNYSKAYIHHLMVNSELLGYRLATMHNIYFINNLMKEIRDSIINGHFIQLKREWI